MEGVWRELSRQQLNGGFLHPAIVGTDQDAAMLELFDVAFDAGTAGATTTQREVELAARSLSRQGRRAEGRRHNNVAGLSAIKLRERCLKLEVAAQAYEDYAGEVYATNSADGT